MTLKLGGTAFEKKILRYIFAVFDFHYPFNILHARRASHV